MFKIKLIKANSYLALEEEVNNFISGKLPVEVNVQEVNSNPKFLASILYKDLGSTSQPPRDLIGSVEVVPLAVKPEPTSPFDKLSQGLELGAKD